MTITKSRIIVMTVIATLLYILIEYAVADDPFFGGFTGEYWPEGAWIRWAALIAIPALGIWQAMRLGDDEIEVEPDRNLHTDGQVSDPTWWKGFTGNVWMSVLWLPLRFVLGIYWLQAGWHKTQEIGWARSGEVDGEFVERGASMQGFLMGAYTPNPETGMTRAVFGWYAEVLEFLATNNWTSWLGPLVAWGETLVGVGLLVGGLVGFAAFFGTLMNMSFMLAGTVSSNPWMFGATVFLIIGWKVAGHLGLDRWLLPALGTPWNRGQNDATVPPARQTYTEGTTTTTRA